MSNGSGSRDRLIFTEYPTILHLPKWNVLCESFTVSTDFDDIISHIVTRIRCNRDINSRRIQCINLKGSWREETIV